jgi:hypothetical protein
MEVWVDHVQPYLTVLDRVMLSMTCHAEKMGYTPKKDGARSHWIVKYMIEEDRMDLFLAWVGNAEQRNDRYRLHWIELFMYALEVGRPYMAHVIAGLTRIEGSLWKKGLSDMRACPRNYAVETLRVMREEHTWSLELFQMATEDLSHVGPIYTAYEIACAIRRWWDHELDRHEPERLALLSTLLHERRKQKPEEHDDLKPILRYLFRKHSTTKTELRDWIKSECQLFGWTGQHVMILPEEMAWFDAYLQGSSPPL